MSDFELHINNDVVVIPEAEGLRLSTWLANIREERTRNKWEAFVTGYGVGTKTLPGSLVAADRMFAKWWEGCHGGTRKPRSAPEADRSFTAWLDDLRAACADPTGFFGTPTEDSNPGKDTSVSLELKNKALAKANSELVAQLATKVQEVEVLGEMNRRLNAQLTTKTKQADELTVMNSQLIGQIDAARKAALPPGTAPKTVGQVGLPSDLAQQSAGLGVSRSEYDRVYKERVRAENEAHTFAELHREAETRRHEAENALAASQAELAAEKQAREAEKSSLTTKIVEAQEKTAAAVFESAGWQAQVTRREHEWTRATKDVETLAMRLREVAAQRDAYETERDTALASLAEATKKLNALADKDAHLDQLIKAQDAIVRQKVAETVAGELHARGHQVSDAAAAFLAAMADYKAELAAIRESRDTLYEDLGEARGDSLIVATKLDTARSLLTRAFSHIPVARVRGEYMDFYNELKAYLGMK